MELSQVKANVRKMASMGAPMEDIDGYIAAAGWTVDDVRNYNDQAQPTEPEKSPYSGVEKAKYFTRAGLNGITLNFMPLGAGVTNAVVTPLAEAYTSISDRRKPIASNLNPWTNFKQGYRDFVNEQKDFGKVHPALNFTGEIVGGLGTGLVGAGKKLATTAAQKGIKALMAEGAREAGKFGFVGGFGSGLTKDPNKISATDALKEGGVGLAGGAVMGAALPPAIAVGAKALSPVVKGGQAFAKKIATILKNDAKQANQALGNAGYVATDMAPENKDFLKLFADNPEGTMAAIESGDPLIAHANSIQLGKTKGAIVANENAEQAYLAAKRAFDEKKIAKGGKFADILLGENSGKEAAERIADEAHSKYQPLYEEVMKMGEIDLPQEIISNETILGAIQEAQGRAGYTKLKANNVRVLDKAKRVLQDKYKSLKKAGKNDEAIEYQLAKEELVNFMDSKLPQYAEARKAFMTGKELEDFVAKGQDIKTLSIKDVENLSKTMSPEEKEAFKSGVADVVRRSLDTTQKEGADVIGKAFDLPLRRKLNILGIGDDDLIKEIAQEIKTNANFRAVGYGSDTAVNLRNAMKFKGLFSKAASVVEAATSPVRTIKSLAEVADNKLQQLSAEEIARLMFDPKALAEEAQKPQHQRRIAEILRKSKQDKSGQSIAGYLGGKLKEKGGYAMKTLGQSGLDVDGLKAKQLSLIKKTNPMTDNYHQGIREIKDIKTFAETLNDPESFVYPDFSKEQAQKALKDGKITIYSSKPIKNGGFVSTSKRMAQDYAGSGKVYSKEVPLDDVAWLSADEGQYAKIKAPKVSEVLNSLGEPVAKTEEGVKNFNKWFKGSKVVDEKGNPLVMYHGTPNATFEEFKPGTYFTSDKQYADGYQRQGASYLGFKKSAEKPGTYETYLSIKKPFDTREPKARDIFYKYYYGQRGVGSDLSERGLPDWMEGEDLIEFLTTDGKKFGYDGLILDEGGTGGYGQPVIDRGLSYLPFKANQVKSVKNSGKFDPKNPNIYKSIVGGLGISQILKSKENK